MKSQTKSEEALEEKQLEEEEEKLEEESEKEKRVVEKSKESEEDSKKESRKQEKKKKELEAVVHIYTSFNNTIVHVTDMAGRTLSKVTGGMVTKHSRLKANPTIAMFIAKRVSEELTPMGIKSLYVKIRAKTGNNTPGPGAHAIIKSLTRSGFKILNILDVTRSPRGGPKKKGGRRGRRV